MFKEATKLKLRFKTDRGNITTEDLWVLSLTEIDEVAKNLYRKKKEGEEESFIRAPSAENKRLSLKFDVVKEVIGEKLKEIEEDKQRIIRDKKKAIIMQIIDKKENEKLEGKSISALKKELEALG